MHLGGVAQVDLHLPVLRVEMQEIQAGHAEQTNREKHTLVAGCPKGRLSVRIFHSTSSRNLGPGTNLSIAWSGSDCELPTGHKWRYTQSVASFVPDGDSEVLAEAYRGAIYEVYGESGPFALVLDQPLPEPLAAQGGAFLTAHNPLSQRQSAELNAAAQARLIQHLQDARLSFSLGEGRAPDGGWREESVWVTGISEQTAEHLAQDFSQLAYLFAEPGGVVQLRFTP